MEDEEEIVMRLKDKVIIITGAGGGMGLHTLKSFINEGAQVIGVDLNIEHVEKEVQLSDAEDKHMAYACDITDEQKVNDLAAEVLHKYGRIDSLINLAGIAQQATPIEEVSIDQWHRLMNINTTSAFLLTKAVVPSMKKANKGSILNIGSIAALRPRPGLNAYIASKGALLSFTKALALELAPHHIRVNAINPGPADTQMLGEFAAKDANPDNVKKDIFASSVPLGRLIVPEDITSAAIYLCSDEAEIVTGSIFNIDGGRGL